MAVSKIYMAMSRGDILLKSIAGIICFCIFYAFVYFVRAFTPGGGSGCSDIIDGIMAEHTIPISVSDPYRSGIFCGGGVSMSFPLPVDASSVTIYGITDAAQQNAIAMTVRRLPNTTHPKPVIIYFFEKEMWVESPGGGGHRSPEILVRKIKIP